MSEKEEKKNIIVLQNPAATMPKQADTSVSMSDIFVKCLVNWPWFVASLLICLSLAFYYAKSQEKIYTRSTSIMIKEDAKTSAGGQIDAGVDMGLFKTTSQVDNELVAIQSPYVVSEVVNRLKLNMLYSTEGTLHNITLYGKTLPVEVEMLGVQEQEYASLKIDLHKDGTYVMSDFEQREFSSDETVNGKLGDVVKTPVGRVRVKKSADYRSSDMPIYVQHISREIATRSCLVNMTAAINSKNTSIIDITYNDVSTKRAEDYLNTIIAVYNENWIKDRNQIAIATSDFIVKRIHLIEQELGDVDNRISNYKSANLIPDLQASSNMSLQDASAAHKQMTELTNQLSMMQYVLEYMSSVRNPHQLLPVNSGIGVANIEQQIATYNEKMLRRNNLVSNSSESNPLVLDLDSELSAMHAAIESSIRNQITTLNTQIHSALTTQNAAQGRLARSPEQGKHLLSVERQQSVKEALYIFLLQKREENELSQAFTAYNTRVITPPFGSSIPTSPVTSKIMLIALILGLALPFAAIYLMESLNTTVRGRKDLEHMKVPFLGELPMHGLNHISTLEKLYRNYNFLNLRITGIKKDAESQKYLKQVVHPGARDVINEAFRVVRGNLEFIKTDNSRVIIVTSANAGSGKTFITSNLGASFAIKGRKTLLIDADLRKRSLSKMFDSKGNGLADYLAHHVDDYRNLILHNQGVENLDILPVGSMPPNPSELLYDERFKNMLDELRNEYDVIFLDCPPVEIVTDVSIVSPLADKTIFVVRAGVFQRNMLADVDRMYEENKLNNMSILLNGTNDRYGKYGYRYGYQYGYGYGYGYGEEKK